MTGIPNGRFSALPGLGIQTRRTGLDGLSSHRFGQDESLLWCDGFHPIYSSSILPLVILRHPPYREKAGGSGFRQ